MKGTGPAGPRIVGSDGSILEVPIGEEIEL